MAIRKKIDVTEQDLSNFFNKLDKIDKKNKKNDDFSYLAYLKSDNISEKDIQSFLKDPFNTSAAKEPKIKIVKCVNGKIEQGSDKFFCETLLHTTARYTASSKSIKLLLAENYKINALDDALRTPLMVAAQYNTHANIVKTLIKSGAKLDIVDCYKKTALQRALENNTSAKVILELLKLSPKKVYKSLKQTPLMIAARTNPSVKVIKMLLENGEDINARDANGMTPLMYAASSNTNPRIISTLLDYGAQIDAKTTEGLNALHIAAGAKWLIKDCWDKEQEYVAANPAAIKVLIAYGSNVNETDATGRTPLLHAIEHKVWIQRYFGFSKKLEFSELKKVIKLLLENGANVNVADNEGMTALMHYIYSKPEVNIVKMLLKYGADVNMRNNKGKTAMDFTHEIHRAFHCDADKKLWQWENYEKAAKIIRKYIN